MAPMPATQDASRRLFIGLFPDASVRAAIDAQRTAWQWPPRCRLTQPQRIHLTLHFLGQVTSTQEAALRGALADVPMTRMALVLANPRLWRNRLAVLLVEPHQGLRALHSRLALEVQRAGLTPCTSAWRPHLTLGRDAPGARPPAAIEPIHWHVAQFALVWSRMGPVTRYQVLARYPAAAPDPPC